MTIEQLQVIITAETQGMRDAIKDMKTQLKSAETSVSKTTSGIKSLFKKMLVGIVALKIGQKIGQAITSGFKNAVQIESSLNQIQRLMGESTNAFLKWADTQATAFGMGRAEAYKYGATFSNLLSNFAKDSSELSTYTTRLLETSAVIASATGRTIEDTNERIRSGLLGSTEAIEDLGINVNVAMLESSEAMRTFANGKSWQQLDFNTQQQIRYFAILEQASRKYGNTLQNTVATQMMMFRAELSNVKTNLGQAFLPIVRIILPLLTKLASALARITNIIAQFSQALFGKSGVSKAVSSTSSAVESQVGSVGDLADGYTKAGKSAKKAGQIIKKAFMGVDEINTLGKGADEVGDSGAGAGAGGAGGGLGDTGGGLDINTGEATGALVEISAKVQEFADRVRNTFFALRTTIQEFIGWIVANKEIVIAVVGGIIAVFASYQIMTKWGTIVATIKAGMAIISGVLGAITTPVALVALGIGALVATVIYLWQTNEEFREGIIEIWNNIKDLVTTIAKDMWDIIKGVWDEYGASIWNNFKTFCSTIGSLANELWTKWLKPVVDKVIAIAKEIWEKHLKGLLTNIGNFVAGVIDLALVIWNKVIYPIISWIIDKLAPVFQKYFPIIADTVGKYIGIVIDVLSWIIGIASEIIDFVKNVFTGDWEGAWENVVNIFEGIFDGIKAVVKAPLNSVIDTVNKAIKGINKMVKTINKVPGVNIPLVGEIPRLAKGGIVNRSTIANIGEAGKEAVLPLENNTGWMDSLADKLASKINGNTGNQQSQDIHVTIDLDGNIVGKKVISQINNMTMQNGKSPILT